MTLIVDPNASTLPPPKRLGRCEGYRYLCGDPATWTIEATPDRDAWEACDHCAREALLDEALSDADSSRVEREVA